MVSIYNCGEICYLPPPPCLLFCLVFSMAHRSNFPTGYLGWKDFCSPSALNKLRHGLARHALAISGIGISLDFLQRGMAGDRGDLVGAASDLRESPCRRLA